MAKKRHTTKVFPEGSLAVQKQTPRQNVNEDKDDDWDDEGKGCCERLKQKKITCFQRVDIFINSTPYMIVMTAFVFIATIIGFISFFVDTTKKLTDAQIALLSFEAVADNVFVIIFLIDVVLRIMLMGFVDYVYDALCFLDLVVSSIDILFFCLTLFTGADTTGSSASADGVGSTTQVLRLFRVFRIIRITKAIRAAKQLLARKSTLVLGLPTPTGTLRFEIDEFTNTITDFKLGIMKVLQAFLLQAMDFHLSNVVLSKDWKNVESKMQNKEINLMAIADKATKSIDLNKLLIDLIMYKRPQMSEAALNLLFCLHFEECSLFNLFHQTQLICGGQEINKVKTMRADLRNLQNLIETFEVWIRESDNLKANTNSLCDYFRELASLCRGNAPMQNVLRDSGAMRAVEQCLQDILPPEYEEVQIQPVSQRIKLRSRERTEHQVRKIYAALNEFIVAFIVANPTNQQLMSEHVDFFIKHIGSLEDSAAVVGATLLDNMLLCAPFSKHNTSEIVKKIDDSRRYSVQCLDALVNIVHVSNTCLRSNQKKVLDSLCKAACKSLLQRQYLVESEEGFALVKKRCEYLHEQAVSGRNAFDEGKLEIRVDDIDFKAETNKMCFHVRLLQLLAYCCEGEVATIEAQSQSLYDYKNLLRLVLSEPVQRVWPLRVALCALFKSMYLITETKKNGLATCEDMHKLIHNLCITLEAVDWEDFQTDVAFSFEAQDFGLQVNILRGFQKPADGQFAHLKTDIWWSPAGFLLPHIYSNILPIILHYVQKYRLEFLSDFHPTSLRIKSALERLYDKCTRSKYAQTEFLKSCIRQCQEALEKLPFQIASPEISRQRRNKIREVIPSIRRQSVSRSRSKRTNSKDSKLSILEGMGNTKQDASELTGNSSALAGHSAQQAKNLLSSRTKKMILNLKPSKSSQWNDFLSQLDQEEILDSLKEKNHTELMTVFKSLSPKGDLSLANILERIVTLIRNKVRTIREHNYYSRKIDDKTTIKLATDAVNFLTFLMSEDHDKNDELEKNFWRDQISSVGAMLLVLDLVAIDIPKDLTRAALDFGTALLEVTGGNTAVQFQAYIYLSNGESEPFFFAVENMLFRSAEDIRSLGHAPAYMASAATSSILSRKSVQERLSMQRSHSTLRHEADALDRVNENSISLRVIEFLQLLCEGNFSQNQSILLAQPTNQVSKNILATITVYLTSVIKHLISSGLGPASKQNRQTGYKIGKQIYELLVDAVQGPCLQNQAFLACETELLEVTNTLLRTFGHSGKQEQKEMDMEHQVYVLLLSLIEGRDDTVVHEKITSMVKFKEVFRRLMDLLGLQRNKKSAQMQPLLYSIITLLFHLRDHNDEWFQHNLKTSQQGKSQRKQWLLTQTRMCDVEIYWMGKLHRVHFAIPHLCDHISQKRLADMEQKFDRSNIDKKLESFMKFSKSMYNEMKGQLQLVNCGLAAVFDARRLERFSSHGFKLSVFITIILLTTYEANRLDEKNKYVTLAWLPRLRTDENLAQTVDTVLVISLLVLGIIMLLLNLYCVIAQVLMRTTLVIAQRKGCMHVFWDLAMWLRLAFLGCALCGLLLGSYPDIMWYFQQNESKFVNPEFYAVPGEDVWRPSRPMHQSFGYILYGFQMFDVFNHNEKAQYVLMAIKLPLGQIVATIFLLMIVGYCATAIAFVEFRSDLVTSNQCDELRTCFLTVFNYGPRLSGGIGDFLSPHMRTDDQMYYLHKGWSFISFILINVIVLNVLFGIIVDTFGQLRATEAESEKDISNVCFICGLDRQILDREGSGFSEHINREHQKWNYLKYIVYLREKDGNDYNGLEHHVVNCIDKGDNGWFPVNRAMCILQNNVPNDDIEMRERQEILQKLNDLQDEFMEMRRNMSNLSANINTSLSERSPDDKFASVVDSVMQKTRISKMLQVYMKSKKQRR